MTLFKRIEKTGTGVRGGWRRGLLRPAGDRGSTYIYVFFITLLILLLALFIYSVSFRKEPPRPYLKGSSGKIEKYVSGAWEELLVGERIEEGWEIRSSERGMGNIDFGRDSGIDLSPSTHLEISRLKPEDVGLHLKVGRVRGRSAGDERFVYTFENTSAVAAVEKGEYSLATDGKGYTEAVAHSGDLHLKTERDSARLKSGEMGRVSPESEKIVIGTIPRSVLLKVKWPPQLLAKRDITIEGETSPGSAIYVNDERKRWAIDGRFSFTISLDEGDNIITVSAVDTAGNVKEETIHITADTSPPKIDLEASGGWR